MVECCGPAIREFLLTDGTRERHCGEVVGPDSEYATLRGIVILDAAYTQLNADDPDAYARDKANYDSHIAFFNMCTPGPNGELDPISGSNTFDGVGLSRGYKLGRFYVATDISKQVDFITAHTAAESPKNGENIGVPLNFHHQLANIELQAFSANNTYNIEVAGVRLGRPYTGNAIFNFCTGDGQLSAPDGGKWGIGLVPQRLPVEYIYGPGDEIYRMGTFTENNIIVTPHNEKSEAKTIMGKGGNAMVIPTINKAWTGKENPWISYKYANDPDKKANEWSRDGEGDMYISLLIRVTTKADGTQVYPYRNNSKMNVVHLSKNKANNVVTGRVKKDAVAGANEEILEFGWATVPVSVNWERGKHYVYVLDFTEGVGIQDPEDENPGQPILGSGITFSVKVDDWADATAEEMKYPQK